MRDELLSITKIALINGNADGMPILSVMKQGTFKAGTNTALVAGGLTVLMVEHELAIMDEFCDPVIAMAEGAVLAMGTMAELRGRAEVVEAYLVG